MAEPNRARGSLIRTAMVLAGTMFVLSLVAVAIAVSRLYLGLATGGGSFTGLELGAAGYLSGAVSSFVSAILGSVIVPVVIVHVIAVGVILGRVPFGILRWFLLIAAGLCGGLVAAVTAGEFTVEFTSALSLASLLAPVIRPFSPWGRAHPSKVVGSGN